MGVNTSDGPVNNAFGQAGLDIDDLAISASAGVPGGIALAVNAAATLPSTWTSGVEIDNGAPVALAFNISDTSPCMMFSIGAEQDGTTALDIANAGVVTASYVNLVIAPDGCTIPTGGGSTKSVPAGYSFAFDGNVLGDATNVSLSVQFDPTIINATLDLQGFDLLGVVSMNTTTINLAMDSSNSSFSLGFSGGFGIGDPSIAGGVINVNGDVISTSPGNFTLVLGGGGNVNLVDVIDAGVASGSNNCPSWTAGLPQPPNNCLVAIQQRSGQVVNADISANLWFGLLGTNLSGDLDLVYSDGTLQDFHLGLGASISFWVGSVGGTAYIDYCQGTLNTNGAAQPTIRAARSAAKAVHSVSSSTAATASDLVVTTGMTTSAGRMGFLTRSLIPVSGMPRLVDVGKGTLETQDALSPRVGHDPAEAGCGLRPVGAGWKDDLRSPGRQRLQPQPVVESGARPGLDWNCQRNGRV